MLAKKIIVGMAISLVAVALAIADPSGSTMTLTLEDGREVNLQPDSTWSYARPTMRDPTDDAYITLSDDRILWLRPNYTWTFTRTQPRANRPAEYHPVAVTGAGSNPALDAAIRAATEDAYSKMAANLMRQAPSGRNVQAFLLACIREEVREHDIVLTYNPGWRAEAKIELPSRRVQRIIECLYLQLE